MLARFAGRRAAVQFSLLASPCAALSRSAAAHAHRRLLPLAVAARAGPLAAPSQALRRLSLALARRQPPTLPLALRRRPSRASTTSSTSTSTSGTSATGGSGSSSGTAGPSTGASQGAHSQPHLTERVREASRMTLQRYREIEDYLRWRGYNLLAISAAGIGALGLVLYFYREQVRESVSDELATVTRRTLQDDELKVRAHELTKAIVQAVLDDPNIAALTSRFLVLLFNMPETKAATVSLLNNVLRDPEALKQTQQFFSWVTAWLAKDPSTQNSLAQLAQWIIAQPATKAATVELTRQVLADPVTRSHAALLVAELMQTETVREQAVDLGRYTTHTVLDDENVQQHTIDFFSQTFSSPDFQRSGGRALKGAILYSFTPSFGLGGLLSGNKNPPPSPTSPGAETQKGNATDAKGQQTTSAPAAQEPAAPKQAEEANGKGEAEAPSSIEPTESSSNDHGEPGELGEPGMLSAGHQRDEDEGANMMMTFEPDAANASGLLHHTDASQVQNDEQREIVTFVVESEASPPPKTLEPASTTDSDAPAAVEPARALDQVTPTVKFVPPPAPPTAMTDLNLPMPRIAVPALPLPATSS